MEYTWQYYDLVLLGIFLSLATGVVVGELTSVASGVAILATGFVAIGIMAHGLFVRGPVDRPTDLTDEIDALN